MRFAILFFVISHLCACQKNLDSIMDLNEGELKRWTRDKKEYEIQIRFTRIKRSPGKPIQFETYTYNENEKEYYYPASTIKMPVAIAALQKLNEVNATNKQHITVETPMRFKSHGPPHTDFLFDSLAWSPPNVKNFVEEIFSISDNNASNRLFEWLGPRYIDSVMYASGAFSRSRILHRVGVTGYKESDHNYLGKVSFIDSSGQTLLEVPERREQLLGYAHLKNEKKGIGYINESDSLVHAPFDFSKKNFISIKDLEGILKRIVFPEAFASKQQFKLTKADYQLLRQAMEQPPRFYDYLKNDTSYYDSYVKFFFGGGKNESLPSHLHILNKVGWAYGYLTDCSYIWDEKLGVEYFLTATIKVNADGIFNDGAYEYDSIGLPFFKTLGKCIYESEVNRVNGLKENKK